MKRKFKQGWSSIPPISRKRTITYHLNWTHWTKKTMTCEVGNLDPGLGQLQNCGWVKRVSRFPTLFSVFMSLLWLAMIKDMLSRMLTMKYRFSWVDHTRHDKQKRWPYSRVTHMEQDLLALLDHLSFISGVRVVRYLVFWVMFCRLLFVLLTIVLSVLRFTASNYPFGIFELFVQCCTHLSLYVKYLLTTIRQVTTSDEYINCSEIPTSA
jgi:hypothetical protein